MGSRSSYSVGALEMTGLVGDMERSSAQSARATDTLTSASVAEAGAEADVLVVKIDADVDAIAKGEEEVFLEKGGCDIPANILEA